MILKIKDSIFAHQTYSTPYCDSKLLQWDRVSKILDDDVVIYTDASLTDYRVGNPNNIAWLIEPRPYHSYYYSWLEENHSNFKEIWTHDVNLLNISNKFKLVPWGGCWVDPKDHDIHTKSKNCSIIASGKTQLQGHRLRHHIIENYKGFDLYGHGYNPVAHKISALKDYRFSICIENSKAPYYFTEKIIDCFKTGTVPIYWGSDKIVDFFNPDGILIFDTFEELQDILKNINELKYNSMINAIKENFKLADAFLTVEDWIVNNKII